MLRVFIGTVALRVRFVLRAVSEWSRNASRGGVSALNRLAAGSTKL
jgi:hypothetical protein